MALWLSQVVIQLRFRWIPELSKRLFWFSLFTSFIRHVSALSGYSWIGKDNAKNERMGQSSEHRRPSTRKQSEQVVQIRRKLHSDSISLKLGGFRDVKNWFIGDVTQLV